MANLTTRGLGSAGTLATAGLGFGGVIVATLRPILRKAIFAVTILWQR